MDQTVLFGVVAVPAIIGLVQIGKETGLPARFSPLLALVFGILAGFAGYHTTVAQDYVQAVVVGIGLGLSASGLYAGASSVTGGTTIPAMVKSLRSSNPTAPDPKSPDQAPTVGVSK